MKQATFVVVGAGGRGTGHAAHALKFPDKMKVVGVAEPRQFYRDNLVKTHDIPQDNVFTTWEDLANRERMADAAIIATQDAMHKGPAIALAKKGYHIFLEKPMAVSEDDNRAIIDEVEKNNVLFCVCHVLRYTAYTRKLKEMVDSGLIGEVVSIRRLEPVGYWHQAHSYIRGNWGNEAQSSFMLLAKSCHDLDWIHYFMGEKCTSVASFGSLKHFRKEEKPEGAATRCIECAVEESCPYSSKRIYIERARKGQKGWPVNVITTDRSVEGVTEALANGPYGRCVYECDNDVVDNQVVIMNFKGGKTASFTMTGFTRGRPRETQIFGTRGELTGDGKTIHHFDFLTEKMSEFDTTTDGHSITSGHGGGDYHIMCAFVDGLLENDPSQILSGSQETLESHLMVFAAERARRENRVVMMSEMGL